MTTITVYSSVVLEAINFPNQIKIEYHELNPATEQPTGRISPDDKQHSWDWIRMSWPGHDPKHFNYCEELLKKGERVVLAYGDRTFIVKDEDA